MIVEKKRKRSDKKENAASAEGLEEEVWSRKPASVSVTELETKLKIKLKAIFQRKGITQAHPMHNDIKQTLDGVIDPVTQKPVTDDLRGHPTFNKWIQGKATSRDGIGRKSRKVLQLYVAKK